MDLGFLRRKKKTEKAKCTITSINLKYMGEMHAIDGISTNENIFKVSIPFSNRPSSDFISEQFVGQSMKIDAINVSAPFALVASEPKVPISIPYNVSAKFELSIKAPDMAYAGPMNIEIVRGTDEFVHISIPKITLLSNGRHTEIEESEIIANMQKNQIFKISVQLYRIMKYGEKISSIEANKPFEVVSSDPKVPISLDRKDSYILEMYIKAPAFGYSGALEISFR